MTDVSIADRMMRCTIVNGYDGLEDLEKLAEEHPHSAWRIIWKVLNRQEDPGKDDGALCFELLKLASRCVGKTILESRIQQAWPRLSAEIQRNLINGFASGDVISIATVVSLFDSESTAVRQRHLIVATLASCRRNDASPLIVELATRIGRYGENEQQRRLESFVQSLLQRQQ